MAQREQLRPSAPVRVRRYFSEGFRKDRVREIERGQSTVREVCKAHGVSGAAVYKWLDKYSSTRKKAMVQVVEAKSEFLAITKAAGLMNSMCEHPWENPFSERVNGTIKNDYLRPWGVDTYPKVKTENTRAIKLYNTERPHSSLGHVSPVAFEHQWLSTVINSH